MEFYTLLEHHPGSFPFEDRILPLWEFNGDLIYGFVDGEEPRFIEYGYEWAKEDYTLMGGSYQEFMTHIFAEFWEDLACNQKRTSLTNELSDEAALLEFTHKDAFFSFLDRSMRGETPPFIILEDLTAEYIRKQIL